MISSQRRILISCGHLHRWLWWSLLVFEEAAQVSSNSPQILPLRMVRKMWLRIPTRFDTFQIYYVHITFYEADYMLLKLNWSSRSFAVFFCLRKENITCGMIFIEERLAKNSKTSILLFLKFWIASSRSVNERFDSLLNVTQPKVVPPMAQAFAWNAVKLTNTLSPGIPSTSVTTFVSGSAIFTHDPPIDWTWIMALGSVSRDFIRYNLRTSVDSQLIVIKKHVW
jgi:hypothetical protein